MHEPFEDTGAVTAVSTVYTGHVVKSDSVVPESLKLELQAAVVELENVPDNGIRDLTEKYWISFTLHFTL